jgi:excinuclease ABC subunit A
MSTRFDGLSPAISIEQKTVSRSPRSTVGTVTEIYDYMRLLFSSIGIPHCHVCGAAITRQSVDQIVQNVLALPEGDRVMVLAPIVRGRKGEFKKNSRSSRRMVFFVPGLMATWFHSTRRFVSTNARITQSKQLSIDS